VAGGAAIWTWDVGVSGVKDAAGQMFSFNGEPALGLNPLLPTRSKKPISVVYDGTRRVESGFFMGNGSAPTFAVKFTKKGTYKVFCNVHTTRQPRSSCCRSLGRSRLRRTTGPRSSRS